MYAHTQNGAVASASAIVAILKERFTTSDSN